MKGQLTGVVDVGALVAALRADNLLYEPVNLRGPAVARRADEAAVLLDVLERRADLDVLALLVPEDFADPAYRDLFAFCVETMTAGGLVNLDTLEADLADRWQTGTKRVRELLRAILEGPALFVPTAADKARALHEVGVLRREFEAAERLDLEARAVAHTITEAFDAGAFRRRLRNDVRAASGSPKGSR